MDRKGFLEKSIEVLLKYLQDKGPTETQIKIK
jgi:hypothetical protein